MADMYYKSSLRLLMYEQKRKVNIVHCANNHLVVFLIYFFLFIIDRYKQPTISGKILFIVAYFNNVFGVLHKRITAFHDGTAGKLHEIISLLLVRFLNGFIFCSLTKNFEGISLLFEK